MPLREWLEIEEPDLYRYEILKLMSRWDKSINVVGDWA
jgi:hypothetical protein